MIVELGFSTYISTYAVFWNKFSTKLKIFGTACEPLYPINFFKIMGITVGKMWFAYYAIDFPSRIETLLCNNIKGEGNELVETGHLDHLCWCLNLWSFRFYLLQRNQYRLMWQYSMVGTWFGENWPPWSSVSGFEILMGRTWEGWFWVLTWWFSKVHLL